MAADAKSQASESEIDYAQLTAPEEFRRAIVKDPYASIYSFDFDAVRGAPLDPATLVAGGSIVKRSGYYFDIDGGVIDWYREGNAFPHRAPGAPGNGRFLFLTDRRSATTSDLRFIVLRLGWDGDVRVIHIR